MPDFLTTVLSSVPWPFPVRPSLENLADPEMRHSLAVALSQLGLAVLLVTIGIVARRGRIVVVLVALTVFFLQGPSLSLLLIAATPTSYRPSPTGFTAAAIASGRQVFAGSCTACHGKTGDGVGGLGSVADLRLAHIWSHPAGDLYWFVSHGINEADGTPAMPAFETVLSERARWSAIDYVYALNAGSVSRGLDGWPHRVPAPPVAVSCGSIAAHDTAELRGNVIRIILGAPPVPLVAVPPVNGIGVVTVWIPGDDIDAAPVPGVGGDTEVAPVPGVDCVAQDGAEAYAILAGSADGTVIPARFLIGPDGVLRSVWRKDDGDAWADPVRLLEEVREICTDPLTTDPGAKHEHHH
jgi:mono/diheme cytochrome c family protein